MKGQTIRGALVALAMSSFCGGCLSPPPRLVTSPSEYAWLVGQRVELVGVVSQTRIPQILGVDVGQLESYRGRKVKVTGILRQSVVTQAQIEETERQMGGRVAHRGPGTRYYLEDVRYEPVP